MSADELYKCGLSDQEMWERLQGTATAAASSDFTDGWQNETSSNEREAKGKQR